MCVGNNQPYAMDGIDFTVPYHAFRAQRPYVEIELRQDLLSSAANIGAWTATLADLLTQTAAAQSIVGQ